MKRENRLRPRLEGRALRAALFLAVLAPFAAAATSAPGPVGTPEVERLASALEHTVSTYSWPDARWSVLVVSLDRNDTLFLRDPDLPMAPASNMKLLTSVAALHLLGPEYRFRTYLLSEGEVRDGVLLGDLVLYGTGDPGISDRFYPTKDFVFQELIDELEARGIREVRGDLVADASYLPGPLRPAGWDPRDLNDHFTAAVSALSYNENVVSLRVVAAPRAGARPRVLSVPSPSGLAVDNRAVTVTGRARPRVGIARPHPADPVLVEGRIRRGARDVWRQLTVPDPAAFSLLAFATALEERGIRVSGRRRIVRTPAESLLPARALAAPARGWNSAETVRSGTSHGVRAPRILARHVSPPLREYLAVVNKKSHNLFAELIFRTLGKVSFGVGTPEASARAVRRALTELGVDPGGLIQLDGSGLSPGNRVTAGLLVEALRATARSPLWPELWYTLPEAGRRRELPRMYRTRAAGNLRAKTGTIDGVSSLSGVVQSADGERLAFSILANGVPSTTRAKRIENAIGARLASFTRGPDATRAGPVAQLPPPPAPSDSGGPSRHRVRRGETFTDIARRYGLTVDELLRANPRIEPRRLQAGSWIRIPAGS